MKRIVASCFFSQKLRDDLGTEAGKGLWHEFSNYMAMHKLRAEDVNLSGTYCPSCLVHYGDFIVPNRVVDDHQRSMRKP
ncbi:MAG TPA: hypothetical protein VLA67_14845 [Nitrospiraceae bacterium]|nr:hypothetical protein [Nitrospiraceae bacterium]